MIEERIGDEMKVAIIGCGLIGEKRALALGAHELVVVFDINPARAERVSQLVGNKVILAKDWQAAASYPDVEIVIVSTTNNFLTQIGMFAVDNGKHVLVEKPAAVSYREISQFFAKTVALKQKVKVGFNLRYHPAIIQAKEMIDSNVIGELMFLRGRYGHGGRVGYEKEWRADPKISGGGELIDQGVHLIDLSRFFLGEFERVDGFVNTYFWDMPVDDNGFVSLITKKGQMAWLHVSCTEWKNLFCLEIYGKDGKLQIDGIGGSYGVEKLTYYKMLPQMGPPEVAVWEYPGEDLSWQSEFTAFVAAINGQKKLNGDLGDAKEALRIVSKLYGENNKI
jgi:predicted dehydrogenase